MHLFERPRAHSLRHVPVARARRVLRHSRRRLAGLGPSRELLSRRPRLGSHERHDSHDGCSGPNGEHRPDTRRPISQRRGGGRAQRAVRAGRRPRRPHRDSGLDRRAHALRAHRASAGSIHRRPRSGALDRGASRRARGRGEESRARRVDRRNRRLHAATVRREASADARGADQRGRRSSCLHASRLLDARHRQRRRPARARGREHRDVRRGRRRSRRRWAHLHSAFDERGAHEAPLRRLHDVRDVAWSHDRRRPRVLRLRRRAPRA